MLCSFGTSTEHLHAPAVLSLLLAMKFISGGFAVGLQVYGMAKTALVNHPAISILSRGVHILSRSVHIYIPRRGQNQLLHVT